MSTSPETIEQARYLLDKLTLGLIAPGGPSFDVAKFIALVGPLIQKRMTDNHRPPQPSGAEPFLPGTNVVDGTLQLAEVRFKGQRIAPQTLAALRVVGIIRLGQLLMCTQPEILRIPRMGEISLATLGKRLTSCGLEWADDSKGIGAPPNDDRWLKFDVMTPPSVPNRHLSFVVAANQFLDVSPMWLAADHTELWVARLLVEHRQLETVGQLIATFRDQWLHEVWSAREQRAMTSIPAEQFTHCVAVTVFGMLKRFGLELPASPA